MNVVRNSYNKPLMNSPKPLMNSPKPQSALPTLFNNSFLPVNTKTSVGNTNFKDQFLNSANAFMEPIKESYLEAKNNTESPILSIGVITVLGVCIVALIIISLFYDQIVVGFELIWHKLKKLFGYKHKQEHPLLQKEHVEQKEHDEEKEHDEQKEHKEKEHNAIDKLAINTMMPSKKEVFNVSQNKYKFSDAEPLCKAFGAELATYEQVKDAWQNGADWCNYGWVKGQSAIFPTQQTTYDKLQAGPEDQKNACGVVGINGGHFDNPDMQFGVNCYGAKPSKNEADDRAHMTQPNFTPDTLEYNRKVTNFKAKKTEIPLNSFAEGVWSK